MEKVEVEVEVEEAGLDDFVWRGLSVRVDCEWAAALPAVNNPLTTDRPRLLAKEEKVSRRLRAMPTGAAAAFVVAAAAAAAAAAAVAVSISSIPDMSVSLSLSSSSLSLLRGED